MFAALKKVKVVYGIQMESARALITQFIAHRL